VDGDLWNAKQLFTAVNATRPSSRAKALSASRFQERKPTSSSITGFDWETAGKGALTSASKALGSWQSFAPATKQLFYAQLETAMTEQNWPGTFEQAVLPHLDAAYNLARWLTRNPQDAEDVVQEAYLRAFRFFAGFRGGDARAWLMRIVRNTCYTWLHVNRPLQDAAKFDENIIPPDSYAPNPEETVIQNDNGALLRRALEMLPPNFREVLILRELEGMSYREIADITGMPAGTVMSSLSRARGRLRQALTGIVNGNTAPNSRRIAAVNT
jgi:RNA polymerase sigma-70 factor (ECF subfamily)